MRVIALSFLILVGPAFAEDDIGTPPPPPPLEEAMSEAPITAPTSPTSDELIPELTAEIKVEEPTKEPEEAPSESEVLGVPSIPAAPTETSEGRTSYASANDYDPRVPPHYYYRPQWAVSLNASPRALPNFGDYPVRGFSVLFEYQPRFVQKIGVISLGPSITVYPVSNPSDVSNNGQITSNVWSIWSVGGVFRYQARWFQNQWFVPTVGFTLDRISYRPKEGSSSVSIQKGPVFGLMLLLNAIDPDTAASSFADPGLVRSYLFAEMKRPTSDGAELVARSEVYQFGLRLEF